jgi:ATP-dependent Clp protease ATP-binding subunit ClpA
VFQHFDEPARQVVVLAQDEARALRHNFLGTEHILLGLLGERRGVAAAVLATVELTLDDARARVARLDGQGDEVPTAQIPFTPRAKKVLELALRESLSLEHNYIGTEHILLGLLRIDEGVATQVLADAGVDTDGLREAVIAAIPERRAPPGVVAPVVPSELASLAVALEEAKRTLIAQRSYEGASRMRELQRRLTLLAQEIEEAVESLDVRFEAPVSARGDVAAQWEYDVRPLEGGSGAWPAQLRVWRHDGWELLDVVPEGERHVAILERRV